MSTEEKLGRIADSLAVIASHFGAKEPAPISGQPAPDAAEPKKARGRQARGEVSGAATPAQSAASSTVVETADPFAETKPSAPKNTLDQVRAAAKAYGAATDQATAVALMEKVSGHKSLGTLTADKYDAVVAAFNDALVETSKPTAEDDPFGETTAPAADAKVPTFDDVKAAVVKAQKRTATDTVQKVVMSHGGKAAGQNGAVGPSLKTLPVDKYAVTIRDIEALPTTK